MFVSLISQQPAVLFLLEQTSHQQPGTSTFLQNKSASTTSHQPNEQTKHVKEFHVV
jgi:hypothetical protein